MELQNEKPYDQFLHQSKALTTILLNFEKLLSKNESLNSLLIPQYYVKLVYKTFEKGYIYSILNLVV